MAFEMLYGALLIGGGIYLFLAATGRIKISPDPEKVEQWQEKWGKLARWLGPITALLGVIKLVSMWTS